MSIPEEMITSHLDYLLDSKPGTVLHHMLVVAAPPSAFGPLGLPDVAQLETALFAIAPDETCDPLELIVKTIMAAQVEYAQQGEAVLFAALGQEVWSVKTVDERARQLMRAGRLGDHPNAVEVTMAYAACRDGRRWSARRILTGPDAGQPVDMKLLLGPPDPQEAFGSPWGRPLRLLVGQPA